MTEVTHRNVAVARIPVVGVLVVLRACTEQQHMCEQEWQWAAQAGQGRWRHGPVDGHRAVWEWRQQQQAGPRMRSKCSRRWDSVVRGRGARASEQWQRGRFTFVDL
ncbi:hypothetical protein B0H10DRAFT_1948412 [Mycena sp. CBHHK59/15]|nr:hypothetical protein B0H10DRAFT_1948412 [Mycena sp. CBHHK59/15]